MSRQEERINAKKVFQNGTTREKLEYLWDYYKWHFLILILVLSFVISMIYNHATKKEYVLQGYFLNTYSSEDYSTELTEDYLKEFPIDTQKQDILINTSFYYDLVNSADYTSYQTLQVFTAKISAGEVDFIVADVDTMEQLAYNEVFYNLSDVLTAEQMSKYESNFLYYDNVLMNAINDIDYLDDSPDIEIIDSSTPEEMEEPIPVMIQITNRDILENLYPNSTDNYAFAFVVTSKNIDKAIEFLNYLNE